MNSKKIIVFGGTFNPLSRAHGELIKYLIKHFKADKGILLPTNDFFLHSWKHFENESILPLALRLKILEEFKKRNQKVEIELTEVNGLTFKSYDSLMYLKDKYPNEEIMFAFGSEKLNELYKWYRIEDLLKNFKIVLIRRHFDNIDDVFNENDFIKSHKSSFVIVHSKDKLQNISSTIIREEIKNKNTKALYKLTYNYVVKILREEGYL